MHRHLRSAAWVLGGLLPWACLGAPPESIAPHPFIVWPAGPMEVRVASDRAADPAILRTLIGRSISFGAASKGSATPLSATLGTIRIAAARLDDAGRTIVLATDPHPREATYVLTWPNAGRTHCVVAYDLSGAEVAWESGPEGKAPRWSGWWPTISSAEARALTAGSVEHERGFALLAEPGVLSIRSFVAPPKGKVTVRLEADGPFEATFANEDPRPSSAPAGEGRRRAEWDLESSGEAVELAATIPTGVGRTAASVRVSYHTETDRVDRPLPRAWQILPWAPPPAPPATPPTPLPFTLEGGDRRRGEALFFGEEARCSACHKVRGRGGDVGPDLGDRAGRDPAELYRDIAEPSAAIKPEYLPYTVALKDGQVAVGVVRAVGPDAIRVLDTNGKSTSFPRSDIEELRPSGTSIMPVGLVGALGEARMRDLLTFLLSPPPPQ